MRRLSYKVSRIRTSFNWSFIASFTPWKTHERRIERRCILRYFAWKTSHRIRNLKQYISSIISRHVFHAKYRKIQRLSMRLSWVFHGSFMAWKTQCKTQWKACDFSVFYLKDVPTNDKRNIYLLGVWYEATSIVQRIENSHVFQWVFQGVFQGQLKEYARLSMGVTMAGTRILWGEVR